MIVAVHQPQYLPWLGFLDKVRACDAFVILDNVQYKKREFQNRNRVRTPEGWAWLTVPVVTKGRYTQPISTVAVDNSVDWRRDHWLSIEHNYARAPYFAALRAPFERIFTASWQRLADLNMAIIRTMMELYRITTPLIMASTLPVATTSTQRIVDICRHLGADEYRSGAGGRDYMDETLFAAAGIRLSYQHFSCAPYPQAYPGFVPDLSAVDHLFNCGGRPW